MHQTSSLRRDKATRLARHKLVWLVLIVLASLALLLASWIGYAWRLTVREDRACAGAASASPSNDPQLQQVLAVYSAANAGVGLQATVILPDGAILSGVSGYASREKACPLTHEHHLYIGSMTKLFVATLAMDQVEDGVISLDDTVGTWVDLPYSSGITVGMLLNHTSGIPSYTDDPWFSMRYRLLPWRAWTGEELVRVMRRHTLDFEPGSRQEYSNSNYVLLAEILEAATGKSVDTLLRETIVEKLGLRGTYFLTYPHDLAIANGYDAALLNLGPVSLGTKNVTGFRGSLAGVILSSSDDVARFVHALFRGEILTPSTLAQMETVVGNSDMGVAEQQGYGLGISHLVIDGEDLFGHTGVVPGYSGIALHNEDKHYTMVILSNLSVIEQTRLVAELQELVIGRVGSGFHAPQMP